MTTWATSAPLVLEGELDAIQISDPLGQANGIYSAHLYGEPAVSKSFSAKKLMSQSMLENAAAEGKTVFLDVETKPEPAPSTSRFFTRKGLYLGDWLTVDQRFLFTRKGSKWSVKVSIYSDDFTRDHKIISFTGVAQTLFPSRRAAFTALALAVEANAA